MTNNGISTRSIWPLQYWLSTRMRAPLEVYVYVLCTWGLYLVTVDELGIWSSTTLIRLALLWLAYWSIYELGYISNDYWAQLREQKAGLPVRKAPCARVSWQIIFFAIATRCFTAAAILWILKRTGSTAVVPMLLLLAAMISVFFLHNVLLGRTRTITFLLLQLIRYFVPFVLLPNTHTLVLVLLLGIPVSVGMTYGYVRVKKYYSLLTNIKSQMFGLRFRIMALLYVIEGVLCITLRSNKLSFVCFSLAAVCMLSDLAYTAARIGLRLLVSLSARPTRYHMHTTFSHDGGWSVAKLAETLKDSGIETVYITEHGEDMDESNYAALKEECATASHTFGVNLIPGIEYTILGQHFLALNLPKYANVDGTSLTSIRELKKHCSAVVWAHPRVWLKRIVAGRVPHIFELLRMSIEADAIEWLNLKPNRVRKEKWRYLAALCIGMYLGPGDAFVGMDSHNLADWEGGELQMKKLQEACRSLFWILRHVGGNFTKATDIGLRRETS